MRTPGDSAMLCRFAHVQSVTFFAHAVVCTVILRRGRGSATLGPDRSRHTRATSVEGAVGTAGPGRASSRRAEPQARGADGERAGGPDGTQNTSDAATTSVPEGGGRAWPPTTHPRHQCGGCRRAKVHSRVPEGGGRTWPIMTHPRNQCGGCRRARRAWPGFEPTRRAIGSRRGRRAGGRARRHPEHRRRSQQESR